GSLDHSAIIRNSATWKRRARLQGHTGAISGLRWSPNGRCLATGSQDGSLRLWRAATGRELVAFHAIDEGKEWVSFTPQGYFVASKHGGELIQGRPGGR